MSRNYTKKYKIAGKFYTVKPENIANKAIQATIQSIPGYPKNRKFSDSTFNKILTAIIAEIEKIEQETSRHEDISEFFVRTFSY